MTNDNDLTPPRVYTNSAGEPYVPQPSFPGSQPLPSCSVCASSLVRPLWLGWIRCETCGCDTAPHGFDPSIYNEDFVAALHNHRERGPLDDDGLREDMRTNLDWLNRLPVPRRVILDAGCARGLSAKPLRAAGWEWYGWEITRYANSAEGVYVDPDGPSALPCWVGAILLREVIEHVPAPAWLLRRLWALTLPGGWIQVQTPMPQPRVDPGLYEPQHLRLYSPEALVGLLWSNGWAVRERLDWPLGQCVVARRLDA
jgi:SAM-dependent methyltransferase